MVDIQGFTQLFFAPSLHGDATTYVLAFLSSTVVELIAVACLISGFAVSVVGRLIRSTAQGDRLPRLLGRLDILSLSKLIIPVSCLTMTLWVYFATQGV